tara:strand:- start:2 stop:949 length:948 start_codon:yes stop_codon:yes gene_type:complete
MKNKENFTSIYEGFNSEPVIEGFGFGGYIADGMTPMQSIFATFGFVDEIVNNVEDVVELGFIKTPNFITNIFDMFQGIASQIYAVYKEWADTIRFIWIVFVVVTIFSLIGTFITIMGVWGNRFIDRISSHLNCAADEFGAGFVNQGKILDILAPCSWEKFINTLNGSCTRYYLVDIVWGIFYGIFIELPIVLIKAIFGIDLYIFVQIAYNLIVLPLDSLFFALSGYHLVKWSDDVINKCYRCKGTWKLANGQEVTMYKTFDEWAKMFKCGNDQMVDGVNKIFKTIFPSKLWHPMWSKDDSGKYADPSKSTYWDGY